jgi:hypothetical protein
VIGEGGRFISGQRAMHEFSLPTGRGKTLLVGLPACLAVCAGLPTVK